MCFNLNIFLYQSITSVFNPKKFISCSNLKTGNFGSLIRVILLRHPELEISDQTDNALFLWQVSSQIQPANVMLPKFRNYFFRIRVQLRHKFRIRIRIAML
jgi:hypothetical protein